MGLDEKERAELEALTKPEEPYFHTLTDAEYETLLRGYERYETVRCMSVQQFQAAYELNLSTGKPFDEIIDDLKPFLRPS